MRLFGVTGFWFDTGLVQGGLGLKLDVLLVFVLYVTSLMAWCLEASSKLEALGLWLFEVYGGRLFASYSLGF